MELKILTPFDSVYRYPAFDFAGKYALYAKTTLTAAFFCPLIPIVTPVAFVGMFIEYWVDKVTIIYFIHSKLMI